ncbi:MAG: PIN domain-containing protein [Microbacteriaceae bacterium]|nr:PIN domain-containing protein [Microbacteriaceae bacterium]
MRVFDSSALLAVLFRERGGIEAAALIDEDSWCGAGNWSEVAQKVRSLGADWATAGAALQSMGLEVEPVDQIDAERAAELWRAAPSLSLADRLCLALGERLGAEVVTADRAWAGRPGVTLIR